MIDAGKPHYSLIRAEPRKKISLQHSSKEHNNPFTLFIWFSKITNTNASIYRFIQYNIN
jgi:hypothetical protein